MIDSEKARAGLRKLAEAMKRVDGLPPAVHPQSMNLREDTSRERFRSGKVPLMRNWPVAYGQLQAGDPPMTDFGVLSLPSTSVLGEQNLAVASSTDNPRAAQEQTCPDRTAWQAVRRLGYTARLPIHRAVTRSGRGAERAGGRDC